MTTIKVHINTPYDTITEEYTLDPGEQADWDDSTPEEREKWVIDIGDSAFFNACNYGTEVVE